MQLDERVGDKGICDQKCRCVAVGGEGAVGYLEVGLVEYGKGDVEESLVDGQA